VISLAEKSQVTIFSQLEAVKFQHKVDLLCNFLYRIGYWLNR